jgi:hypothetical protein
VCDNFQIKKVYTISSHVQILVSIYTGLNLHFGWKYVREEDLSILG